MHDHARLLCHSNHPRHRLGRALVWSEDQSAVGNLHQGVPHLLARYVPRRHTSHALGRSPSGYQQPGQQARKIFSDAVKGRYEGKMEPGTGGAMFSAIQEAYAQLNLTVYNKIVDLINAEREAFKNAQTLLLSQLQTYTTWKNTDIIRQWFVVKYFPSSNLEARIGTRLLTGAAALEQIQLLVTSQGTDDAFNTGKQGPIDFQPK